MPRGLADLEALVQNQSRNSQPLTSRCILLSLRHVLLTEGKPRQRILPNFGMRGKYAQSVVLDPVVKVYWTERVLRESDHMEAYMTAQRSVDGS